MKHIRLITVFSGVTLLGTLISCGALTNTGAGSGQSGSLSTFGLAGTNGNLQGISWTTPSYGNPSSSGRITSYVIQENPDKTMWWQHCFNNNSYCANNDANTVRNVVGNDPTVIHALQLNINRSGYSAVSYRMSVRTAELQFSTSTGQARLVNPQTQNFNQGLAGSCQPGAANAVAFWPQGAEAAVITGLYLLEEYTAAPRDQNGRQYFTGAHLTGGRVWSRAIVPGDEPYEAGFIPQQKDVVEFGAYADNLRSTSDAQTFVSAIMGDQSGSRVITGICIEGTKIPTGASPVARPVMLGMRVHSYIPSVRINK